MNLGNYKESSIDAFGDAYEYLMGMYASNAGKSGGEIPAVFNGADEVAVKMFLDGKIKFTEIPELIEKAMSDAPVIKSPTLDDIIEADKYSRSITGGN